jgi:Sulfotransferase domain
MRVLGAGVGRTGTYSLKLALDRLGRGPHHMGDVFSNMPTQVPLWAAAAKRQPNWPEIYKGYSNSRARRAAADVERLPFQRPKPSFNP